MVSAKKGIVAFVVAIVAAMMCSAAFASTVTFDFQSGRATAAQSLIFNKSGLKLTVAPFAALMNANGTVISSSGYVDKSSEGLSPVITSVSKANRNADYGNFLSFAFNQTVKLLSVTFYYCDSPPNAAYFFDKRNDGKLAGDLIWADKKVDPLKVNGHTVAHYGAYTYAAIGPYQQIGSLFGFGTFEDDEARFKIASITVSTNVSTVPLPSAALLLGSGLIGLAMRRKRKA